MWGNQGWGPQDLGVTLGGIVGDVEGSSLITSELEGIGSDSGAWVCGRTEGQQRIPILHPRGRRLRLPAPPAPPT